MSPGWTWRINHRLTWTGCQAEWTTAKKLWLSGYTVRRALQIQLLYRLPEREERFLTGKQAFNSPLATTSSVYGYLDLLWLPVSLWPVRISASLTDPGTAYDGLYEQHLLDWILMRIKIKIEIITHSAERAFLGLWNRCKWETSRVQVLTCCNRDLFFLWRLRRRFAVISISYIYFAHLSSLQKCILLTAETHQPVVFVKNIRFYRHGNVMDS